MTSTKIKLLFNRSENATFLIPGHNKRPIVKLMRKYFDLEEYDSTQQYDIKSSVLMTPLINKNLWWQKPYDQGFKLIIDNMWELPSMITQYWIPDTDQRTFAHKPIPPRAIVLQSPDFFWYLTSGVQQELEYHLYLPQRQQQFKALIPINQVRAHRTQLINQLGKNLDECMWSYAGQGQTLPNDLSITDHNWQSYINTKWYDQCCFSVVAETVCNDNTDNYPPFITEKTWKAISMQHPFMIVGQTGTLQYLHQLGFETFENLWDETYDHTSDVDQRIAQVVNNVVQYTKAPLDKITLQKIQHNYDRFFNQTLIEQRMIQQVIEPIIEYASK
jgi:hypothetical protein